MWAEIHDPWNYERRPLVPKKIQSEPDLPPPFQYGEFMKMFGRREGYISLKGTFKKAGKGIEKAGKDLKKGFESTGKAFAASSKALAACKPKDVKCIGKNLGNAIKNGVELGFPVSTAIAAEVGGGNVDAGYKKIGKELYSVSGIEGIVKDVQAIKACKGNAACIAKNLGELLMAVAALASNAIPGVGAAADAAQVARTSAMVAEKAVIMAQDARKIAKTAQEIKHAEQLEKAAREAKMASNIEKDSKDVEKQKNAMEKIKDLNDKMKDVQQNAQTVADNIPPKAPPSGPSGKEIAAGVAGGALLVGGAAYAASKMGANRGAGAQPGVGGAGAQPGVGETGAQPGVGETGAQPGVGGPGGTGGPVNISINVKGIKTDEDINISSYDGTSAIFLRKVFIVFLLIICFIVVAL